MELLPLVCLCLLSWSGTTSADHHVVVEEGSDVILPCSFGGNIGGEKLVWKKGLKDVFVYDSGIHHNNGRTGQDEQFKGRVSYFEDELKHGNVSIKIRNAKVADSGNYTCDVPHNPTSKIVHVELFVGGELKDRTGENITGAAPEPFLTILDQRDNWVQLQCEAHGVPDPEVHWQDSDRKKLPAEEPQVSERGGRKYITLNTTVTKTGNFFCVATQKNLSHRISAKTYVRLPGAAPKPSVTILDQTENSALLQCEAHGVPDLEVHWQDSDGNKLTAEEPQVSERGGRKYITLNTTVTKTDRFSCVATQENLSHNISTEIYVRLNGIVVVKKGRAVILPCSPNFNTESQMFHWKKDGQKEVFVYRAGLQSDGQDVQFKGRVSHFQDELKHGNASIKITNTKVDDSGNYTCEFPNLHPSPTFKIELVVVGEPSYTGWIVAKVFISLFVVALVVGPVVGVLFYKRYTKRKHKKDKKQPEEEPMTQPNPEKQADPEAEALKSVKSE